MHCNSTFDTIMSNMRDKRHSGNIQNVFEIYHWMMNMHFTAKSTLLYSPHTYQSYKIILLYLWMHKLPITKREQFNTIYSKPNVSECDKIGSVLNELISMVLSMGKFLIYRGWVTHIRVSELVHHWFRQWLAACNMPEIWMKYKFQNKNKCTPKWHLSNGRHFVPATMFENSSDVAVHEPKVNVTLVVVQLYLFPLTQQS